MLLRNLVRCFDRALRLHIKVGSAATAQQALAPPDRLIFTQQLDAKPKKSALPATVEPQTAADEEPISVEVDQEYIRTTPYHVKNECGTNANAVIQLLRQHFRLSQSEAVRIMSDDLVNRNYRKVNFSDTVNVLLLAGVSKRSFLNYPWLLTLECKQVEQKLQLLKTLNITDINHVVPFVRLSITRLRKLLANLRKEENTIPNGNRIYYISDKLEVSPEIVAKYLCKRLFILEMPFEMFEQNLQHMINYNVSPINILKDLWAFRYMPKSVQVRLERAKRAKKEKIMPWMVRCPESILQRSLKLSMDELKVLGDFSSVAEYIAHRLQFTVDEAKAIMDIHPQVHTVRVTKIKEVFDYLLDVEKFTRFQVAQVPRILCHSLKTTKARIDELKSIGCRPSSLVIVCRSKREYQKFVQSWINTTKGYDNSHIINMQQLNS